MLDKTNITRSFVEESDLMQASAGSSWIHPLQAQHTSEHVYSTSDQNDDDFYLSNHLTAQHVKMHHWTQLKERCHTLFEKFVGQRN